MVVVIIDADTYLWSNGDTNQTTTATSAGTYTCTVTTAAGCVYATSYTYNGSLNLTFDCSQMDIFEANNDYNVVSFQSDYLNNNNLFPELIDSLSFWDVYDAERPEYWSLSDDMARCSFNIVSSKC